MRWARPFGLAAAALVFAFVGIQQFRRTDDASMLRSGTVTVTLVAPANTAARDDSIAFVWRSVAGATYEVELFTADGTPVLSRTTSDTTVVIAPRTTASGDFRWWVTAQLDDGTQARSAARRVVIK